VGILECIKSLGESKLSHSDVSKQEHLKTELSILLEEYNALRAEIISTLESGRQVTSLTLVAIGALIAGIPYISQSQIYIVFLIAPLFFYCLAWTQLRYISLAQDIGDHIRTVISPRVLEILFELSPEPRHDFRNVMSWEDPGKNPMFQLRRRRRWLLSLLFLPIAGSNYGTPLLGAVLSVCAYLMIAFQNALVVSFLEIGLISINVVAFIYSVFWGFQAELRR
jgi:hypothetical protein